jgi:HEAT repeat protein
MSLDFDERDRRSLLADLASADAEARRLAVERVVGLPADEAVDLLVERLGDASWRVRKAAVERLVAMPDTAACAERLIGALADGENPGRRNAAVEALVRCGARAVPHLVAALGGSDPDVRKLALDTLAGIGDPRAEGALLCALGDPDPNVRAAAAEALGTLGGSRVQRALRALATRGGEERLVRLAALRTLAALDAPAPAAELAPLLDDAILRPAALEVLGRSEEGGAAPVLLKWLAADSRASRMAAVRSLVRLLARCDGAEASRLVEEIREAARASAAVDDAIAALAHSDLATQLVAVQFLGIVREPRAAVPILRAARDEALLEVCLATLEELGDLAEAAIDAAWPGLDPPARRAACALLARTRGIAGAERLLAALEEGSPELRGAAAEAVGRRRLAAALPALLRRIAALADADELEAEEESAALVDALVALAAEREPGSSGEARGTLDLLAGRLAGAAERERLAIATVLGRAGGARDTATVALLLKDPSARVRRAAVEALARLDPGTAAEPLRLALADEAAEVRIAAASALGASASDAAIDDLERLADDRDARVRAAAVRAIGRRLLGCDAPDVRARGLARLEAALADGGLVALAAVEALREIGGPAARAAARILARPDPELVKEAVACLAAHGDANDLAAIEPLLAHADWSVRAQAISALAQRRVARSVPAILRRLELEQDEFVRAQMLRALEALEG